MLFVCDSHSQRMVYIHLYVSVQTFLFALKTNQLGDKQKDCNETDNHRSYIRNIPIKEYFHGKSKIF